MFSSDAKPCAESGVGRGDQLARRDLVLMLVTIVVLVIAVAPLAIYVRVLEYDEAVFMDVARNIQRLGLPFRSLGSLRQPAFEHTPLYLYLLSFYARFSETGVLAARAATFVASLGCVILTFLIGRAICGSIAGFVAALLLAVNSFFTLHAFFVRMEVPMVLAMLGGLVLILASERRQRLWVTFASGVMLAIAFMFKELVIPFIGWCAIYVVLACKSQWRACISALSALLGPLVFAVALWAGWAWRLSPIAYINSLRRWLDSISSVNLLDPRVGIGLGQWAQKIGLDLLGPALVIGLAGGLLIQFGRLKWRPSGTPWLTPAQGLLWGYLLSAIAISFGIRLKELRHLIGILPVACLLIGTSVDWRALAGNVWRGRSWARKAIFSAAVAIFLLSASPLRWPVGPITSLASWLDPVYGWRLLENDRFYRVLQLTGRYLQEQTAPTDVITVAHQATVTAYYADRHYLMLYTLPRDAIERVLAKTNYLVWDDEDFHALTRAEVEELRHQIEQRFTLSATIRDGNRAVKVYRR